MYVNLTTPQAECEEPCGRFHIIFMDFLVLNFHILAFQCGASLFHDMQGTVLHPQFFVKKLIKNFITAAAGEWVRLCPILPAASPAKRLA